MAEKRPLCLYDGRVRELQGGDAALFDSVIVSGQKSLQYATDILPPIRPSLLLDFANSKALDPRITFTRASTATYFGADGLLKTAAVNEPRFDHDPATGECKGLLIEEQRTNLLLNSDSMSTQNVTVTAVAHTLSFYGPGTVTLSGASTAGPLTGTGDNDRVFLTFTPAAGTLTLTVSGSVNHAQLEVGSFPTSYIPTTSSAVTRSADVASMTGTNFSGWYNPEQFSVAGVVTMMPVNYSNDIPSTTRFVLTISDGTSANSVRIGRGSSSDSFNVTIFYGGVVQANLSGGTVSASQRVQFAAGIKTDDVAICLGGGTVFTDTTATLPTVNRLHIGSSWSGGSSQFSGHISRIAIYPMRLSNAILQGLTS